MCLLEALNDHGDDDHVNGAWKKEVLNTHMPDIKEAWKISEVWRQYGVLIRKEMTDSCKQADDPVTRRNLHDLGRSAIYMHFTYTAVFTNITNALREAEVSRETLVKASLKALYPSGIPPYLDDWILGTLTNEEGGPFHEDPPGLETKSTVVKSLRSAILEAIPSPPPGAGTVMTVAKAVRTAVLEWYRSCLPLTCFLEAEDPDLRDPKIN
eukprot:GHVO01063535.1.p1 GENE.GHVO01063535.1~~GHVO01063535.1.p1  ORF type:complete len:211 (-),score=36.12 GHVO01063535.1:34-666(-)